MIPMTSRAVCGVIRLHIARGDLSQSAIAREASPDVSTLEIARNPENYRGRTGAVGRKNIWKIVRVYERHAEQIEGHERTDAEA